MAASTREINRSLLPSAKTRATIAKRLAGVTGKMATATIAEMEARYHWFRRLDAEHRSCGSRWWPRPASTVSYDGSPPRVSRRPVPQRSSARRPASWPARSPHQTVELVRTTIEVESQIDELMPKGDRPILHVAIDQYSREAALGSRDLRARG